MKKILLSFLAVLMALGVTMNIMGCSGDLHDEEAVKGGPLAAGGIAGAMQSWNQETVKWDEISADGKTYTYKFTATDESAECKVLRKNNWNSGAWGGTDGVKEVPADGTSVALDYDNSTGGGKNVGITGLEPGTEYTVTVVYTSDTDVKMSVSSGGGGGGGLPVPYMMDGMYLVGEIYDLADAGAGAWSFSTTNLIWGATVDALSGEVVYTKDIIATKASGQLGINDSAWNKLAQKDLTITANEDYATIIGDKTIERDNFSVSGLEVGGTYRVYIKTTSKKDVLVKVEKILAYTIKFQMTGVPEGNRAWFNGAFREGWGFGWPTETGWDNAAPGTGLSDNDYATADSSGVAAFSSKWNITGALKSGDTVKLTGGCKGMWGSDFTDDNRNDTGGTDLTYDLEIDDEGTYMVTITTDGHVTMAKQP